MKRGRYRRGDMIGQTGLERLLDEYLRGRDGGERIEVDALGRPVQIMQREEPDPGAQVITTIDRRIQEAAERAMAGQAGSVVVMDPRNGDVLALTSSPAFPLDRLDRQPGPGRVGAPGERSALRSQSRAAGPVPARARCSRSSWRRPGSRKASLTPMDRIYCNGEFTSGNWTFKDWKPGGHGHVDLRGAIVQSCDVFFYQAGLKVAARGDRALRTRLRPRRPTGMDLAGEQSGLVPSPEGRARERGRPWHSGDTLNMSIGQGAAPGDPAPGRAHDGGHRQRRRDVEAAAGPACRARRTARSPTPRRAR